MLLTPNYSTKILKLKMLDNINWTIKYYPFVIGILLCYCPIIKSQKSLAENIQQGFWAF
jgi:hypothetical protein